MNMMPPRKIVTAGGMFGTDSIYRLSAANPLGFGTPDPHSLDNESLARLARTLISRHFDQLTSDAELAALLGIERERLVVAFLATYDSTIENWIVREKFRMARRLLAQTSLGLPEIARRVGFSHPSAFATSFRELVGISPWAFRQLPYHEQIAAIELDE
jgi:AraC-like DNA-binding protein